MKMASASPQTSNAVLDVRDVRKTYRNGFWLKSVEVLKGVSLQVPKNSIFGFVGPNGAGKTTLIQLIVGIRQPTSGQVIVGGFSSSTLQARTKVGYLPERPYFYEHLTGRELLTHYGTLSGIHENLKDKITKVLSTVGLSHATDLELRRYSKGMLQRIGIAQSILHDPELLVFDEPMSGLDPVGRKEIRELLQSLKSQGKTIFFSSHVIPDVESICDSVALIRRGEMIASGPMSQLAGTLEKFYEQGSQ
jgi:ABC-2 type transport system ATP-binding protein